MRCWCECSRVLCFFVPNPMQALMLMIKEQVHGSAAATMRGLDALLQKTRAAAHPGVHKLAVRAVT